MKKQIDNVRGSLGIMGTAIGTAVGGLAVSAITAAASALTGFISRGIAGASNLGESLSKVDAVFGKFGPTITNTADQLARDFGLSRQSILDAGAAIGLIGKGAGYSQGAAAGLGSNMAKLAADAASFYNVPLDVALEKIRSGLVGEAEPLRAFGVLLTEEAVAAEAVALGLARSAKAVDNQAKVAARASLITKGLKDATGDLERTSDSTSNQWKKLTGTLENMAVEVGSALMPAINSLLNGATEMINVLKPGFESLKASFSAFSDGVVATVQTIGIVWRNLGDEWQIVTIKAREMGLNIMEIVGTIPANLAIVGEYIANNWVKLLADGFTAAGTVFTNLVTNLTSAWQAFLTFISTGEFKFDWKPLLDGFTATAAKLPELVKPQLTSLQSEIDAVAGRIADREGARAAAAADKAKATKGVANATAAAAAKKASEFKSETLGSADFASKLRESVFSKADDTEKRQLAAQERIAKATEESRDVMKRGLFAVFS